MFRNRHPSERQRGILIIKRLSTRTGIRWYENHDLTETNLSLGAINEKTSFNPEFYTFFLCVDCGAGIILTWNRKRISKPGFSFAVGRLSVTLLVVAGSGPRRKRYSAPTQDIATSRSPITESRISWFPLQQQYPPRRERSLSARRHLLGKVMHAYDASRRERLTQDAGNLRHKRSPRICSPVVQSRSVLLVRPATTNILRLRESSRTGATSEILLRRSSASPNPNTDIRAFRRIA